MDSYNHVVARVERSKRYYIFIHKNLLEVDHITEDLKLKYAGSKVYVLDHGRVHILSTKSLADTSKIYYGRDVIFKPREAYNRDLRTFNPQVFGIDSKALNDLSTTLSAFVSKDLAAATNQADHLFSSLLTIIPKVHSAVDDISRSIKVSFSVASFITELLLFINNLTSFPDKSAGIFRISLSLFACFHSLYTIVRSLCSLLEKDMPELSLSSMVVAFTTAFSSVKNKVSSFIPQTLNGMESLLCVTILEQFLPKKLRSILVASPLYTRNKVLDDSTLIQDIMSWIFDLPLLFAKVLCLPPVIVTFLENLSLIFPYSSARKIKNTMTTLLEERTSKPSLVCDSIFQEKVLAFSKEVDKWKASLLVSHEKLPYAFKDTIEKFNRLVVKVGYMKNPQRQEPVFLVFYGKPGTGKTTSMLKLVNMLRDNNTTYFHVCPGEKDFYDQYDNEDIMVIDDIGQKGIVQWADMINFVSSAQCPMNCAEVSLKGTKRFTSLAIFATTNNINLRITPSDPLQDVEALYRRMHVIDFNDVNFQEGSFSGTVNIRKRNKNSWETIESFPATDNEMLLNICYYLNKQVCAQSTFTLNNSASCLTSFPKLGTDISKLTSFSAQSFMPYSVPSFVPDPLLSLLLELLTWPNTFWILAAIIFCILIIVLYAVVLYLYPDERKQTISLLHRHYNYSGKTINQLEKFRSQTELIKSTKSPAPSVLESMSKSACFIYIMDELGEQSLAIGMVFGRTITTVRHCVENPYVGAKYTLSISNYKDQGIYEGIECTVAYCSDSDDVIILKIPDTLPVYFRHVPEIKSTTNTKMFLIKPGSPLDLSSSIRATNFYSSYSRSNYKGMIGPNDYGYDYSVDGACGSWLVTQDGFLLGHHVAGDVAMGISKVFSQRTIKAIFSLMKCDSPVIPTLEHDFDSVVKVDSGLTAGVVSKNTIVPSLIYGAMPLDRVPAEIGDKSLTLKMASAAFVTPKPADPVAMSFAVEYMQSIVPEFGKVSYPEALTGGNQYNKVDLTTSAGYGFKGSKGDYFVDNKPNTILKTAINLFKQKVWDGKYDFSNYHQDCLKVELRDVGKEKKPRVFSAAPIDIFMLEREYLLDFLYQVETRKWENGVMVGINPFGPDWERLLKYVTRYGDNVFDGDISGWDKYMLPEFQRKLNDIILSKATYGSKDKLILAQLLELLPSCPKIIGNDTFITTHSLPSGRLVTADYNSLINRFYCAYLFAFLFYKRYLMLPTIEEFNLNVTFVSYGDDCLVAASPLITPWFNAISYAEAMHECLGLTFTTAQKGKIEVPFKSIYECTFLKRSFRIHPILGIVAPLDPKSMQGTLNYVKDNFRNEELTNIKILNYQREAFLHYDYKSRLKELKLIVEAHPDIFVTLNPDEYLLSLYRKGEFSYLTEHSHLSVVK